MKVFKPRPKLGNLLIFTIVSYLLFSLCSCNVRAEQKSLTSQFEVIDSYILLNQFRDAEKELKKMEKKVYDSWSFLGIYKRYRLLGDDIFAERVLKTALKKNPHNNELLAVYTNFLLKKNRFQESIKYALELKGTRYESFYAEAFLKNAFLLSRTAQNDLDFYTQPEFYEIYLAAYNANKNPIWLKNCALAHIKKGQKSLAANLVPEFFSDCDDAYFWAMVLYDAGRFYDAINIAEVSKSFLNDYSGNVQFRADLIKLAAIESDSYIAVSDLEKAEKSRQSIVMNLDNLKLSPEDQVFLPILMANSAIWAMDNGYDEQSVDLLFYLVSHWNTFVPGLIMYADYAYASNLEREEDSEIKALRKAGLQTLEMAAYDSRRKIPVSDAIFRINEALKKERNPYLEIKLLDLKYKTNQKITEKEKESDLWFLLEKAGEESKDYRVLLLEYALNYFLHRQLYKDSWDLFKNSVSYFYEFDDNLGFWEQVLGNLGKIDLKLCEFAAYFAAEQKLLDETKRILEYCVYESSGILDSNMLSQNVSTQTCLNLGDLYFSTGSAGNALELYGRLSGREAVKHMRSDIFYRIANIHLSSGEVKDALRAIEYACSIDPDNAKASVLKDKLKINK